MASEVRELLNRIEAEWIATQQGLTGLASGTSRHDFINAKVRRVDELYEQVEAHVGSQKAIALTINAMGVAESACQLAQLQKRMEQEGYGHERST